MLFTANKKHAVKRENLFETKAECIQGENKKLKLPTECM